MPRTVALLSVLGILCAFSTSCAPASARHRVWSNASLNGSYDIVTTIKPYVKFAGGPRLGTGTLIFDGKGSFSGEQTFEGEHDRLSGTYQIAADGTGVAYLISTAPDGGIAKSEYTLKIENENKISSVSYGLPVTSDWVSSEYLLHNAQPAYTSVLTRVENQ